MAGIHGVGTLIDHRMRSPDPQRVTVVCGRESDHQDVVDPILNSAVRRYGLVYKLRLV